MEVVEEDNLSDHESDYLRDSDSQSENEEVGANNNASIYDPTDDSV